MKQRVIDGVEGGLRHLKDWLWYRKYVKQYRSYNKMHGIDEIPAEGEDLYLKLWHKLANRVEPHSYRLFCRYCGYTPYIVPEDIGHRLMEPVLNPLKYRRFYEDKNLYSQYISNSVMPRTVMRRIGGGVLLDSEYKPITPPYNELYDFQRIIIKPSTDSCSGQGIYLFEKHGDRFITPDGLLTFNHDFVASYGNDFIVQEVVTQHPFMAQFCRSSVNTLRIATYRSVKDDEVHVTGAIMRIGLDGSFVDNAHAGGCYVGIDIQSGEMGHKLFDQYGNVTSQWNGIDFTKNSFVISFWDKVMQLARYIGNQHHHMRLLALDIAIREDGQPIFIEANVNDFSYWLFMFTGHSPFGKLTDEIIDHCASHRQSLKFDFFKNI